MKPVGHRCARVEFVGRPPIIFWHRQSSFVHTPIHLRLMTMRDGFLRKENQIEIAMICGAAAALGRMAVIKPSRVGIWQHQQHIPPVHRAAIGASSAIASVDRHCWCLGQSSYSTLDSQCSRQLISRTPRSNARIGPTDVFSCTTYVGVKLVTFVPCALDRQSSRYPQSVRSHPNNARKASAFL